MAQNYVYLRTIVPLKFRQSFNDVIGDELRSAQIKWKVKLSDSALANVTERSLEQLVSKVNETFHSDWDIDKGVLFMKLSEFDLELPDGKEYFIKGDREIKDILNTGIKFTLSGGVVRASTITRRTISLGQLLDSVQDLMEGWLKTAVFYGVGSYASQIK